MALRLKLDENLPNEAADVASRAGCEVETALNEGLGGHSDDVVMAACRREERVLVTLDLDFADTRAYPPGSTPGVVVLRPATQAIGHIIGLFEAALRLALSDEPAGRLWVVEPGRVRIRE